MSWREEADLGLALPADKRRDGVADLVDELMTL